jgi:hypothetical protein
MRWLSKLDFWQIHEQHVVEREEGTGKISSRLEREFSYWLDAANGYVWLRGHRKTLTTIKRLDTTFADSNNSGHRQVYTDVSLEPRCWLTTADKIAPRWLRYFARDATSPSHACTLRRTLELRTLEIFLPAS